MPSSALARETVTFDFAAHPWTETVGDITEPIVQSEVTLTTTNGGTATRLYSGTNGVDLRLYAGGTLNFTAPDGKVIEKIEFTGTKFALSVESGSLDSSTKTWTQPETQVGSVTFTATEKTFLTKAVLTIADQGEGSEVVVIPEGDITSRVLSNPGFEACEANTTDLSTAKDAGVDYTEQGWKVSASGGNCNAAVYAYGSATILNSVTAPAADNAGNPGKAMGVTVAWSSNVKYTTATPITLPAGIYTIKINGYNAFGSATLFHSNLAFVAEDGTVIASSSKSNFASNVWEDDVISFTLDTETTGNITFGGYAENKGSGSHARVFFDNITIERFTELTWNIALLNAEIANAQKWTVLPTTELADAIASAQNVAGTATDSETVLAALAALQSAVAAYSETIAGGTYYLKNVATGKYLAGGSSWGTHAIVDAHGIDLGLAALSDGKYTIDTQLSNGGEKHYLNGVYCDGDAFGWTFVQTTTEAGEAAFAISDGTNYLTTADGTDEVSLKENVDDYSKWVVLSLEDRMAELQTATADNGKDASWLLPGRNFGRNDLRNSKWTGTPSIGGDNTNMCAEKYNTTFDVYQTINVPNGLYKVEVQGFYRNGGYADAAAKHVDGSEQLLAAVYANTAETPLQSIFTEAGKVDAGVTTDGIEGKFPNSMANASAFFSAGLYNNVVENVAVVDGTLTVGVRKSEAVDSDWSIFDNFRITYYGEIEDLTAYKNAYDAAFTAAQAALAAGDNAVVTGDERTALESAISTYCTVEANKDAYVAATTALNAATSTFTSAVASYQALEDTKVEYGSFDTYLYPYASSEKKAAIQVAIDVEASSAADATEKKDAILTAVRAFVESNALAEERGAEKYTSYIKNPNAQYHLIDWTTTLGDGSGGKMGVYSSESFTDADGNSDHGYFDGGDWGASAWDITFSQDVTLPSGEYLLTATARASQDLKNFTLFAGNDTVEMTHIGNTGGIFNRGWNDNFVVFNVYEDNTPVTIGVQGVAQSKYQWMSFTRFRLVRLGVANIINGIQTENLDNAVIYSINGQVVRTNATTTKGLAKGVYVVNGKKVVVK